MRSIEQDSNSVGSGDVGCGTQKGTLESGTQPFLVNWGLDLSLDLVTLLPSHHRESSTGLDPLLTSDV